MANKAFAVLTSGGTGVDASSFATASISPSAGKLILICVYVNETSGTPPVPSLSGCSITWAQVATSTTGTVRAAIFGGTSASPSSGAVTIDFSGNSQSDCEWIVVEGTGFDIGGTSASNAIVQTNTNTGSGISSLLINLSSFSNPANVPFGFVCSRDGPADYVTPGSGFIELANVTVPHNAQAQWQNAVDTSVDWSFSQPLIDCCGVAVELRAASEGGGGLFPVFL